MSKTPPWLPHPREPVAVGRDVVWLSGAAPLAERELALTLQFGSRWQLVQQTHDELRDRLLQSIADLPDRGAAYADWHATQQQIAESRARQAELQQQIDYELPAQRDDARAGRDVAEVLRIEEQIRQCRAEVQLLEKVITEDLTPQLQALSQDAFNELSKRIRSFKSAAEQTCETKLREALAELPREVLTKIAVARTELDLLQRSAYMEIWLEQANLKVTPYFPPNPPRPEPEPAFAGGTSGTSPVAQQMAR